MRKLALAAMALAAWAGVASASAPVSGATPGEWTQAYQAAKALAARKGIPILLNFSGSDWCYWCKLMDRQVFSQQAWGDWAKDNIALVLIDFPRDKSLVPAEYAARNEGLMKKYAVPGFPTFILLSPDAKTVLGQLGASRDATPESFIAEIEALTRAKGEPVATDSSAD